MLSIPQALERIKDRVTEVVSAELIDQRCQEVGYRWRDRELGPVVTTHLFLQQVLHGNIAVAELRRLSGYLERNRMALGHFLDLFRILESWLPLVLVRSQPPRHLLNRRDLHPRLAGGGAVLVI